MKIFTLESKQGDVLGIFTTNEEITYSDFYEICREAGELCDNDFYMIKDKLIHELNFNQVEYVGGFHANKKKGIF